MNHAHPVTPELDTETRKLRQASAEARALLGDAAQKLRALLQEEPIMAETPLEARAVMESAVEAIDAALRQLESAGPAKRPSAAPAPPAPSRPCPAWPNSSPTPPFTHSSSGSSSARWVWTTCSPTWISYWPRPGRQPPPQPRHEAIEVPVRVQNVQARP